MKYINDTITAIASGWVTQAISIIRVSGQETYEIINKLFSKNLLKQKGYSLTKGYIFDKNENIVDEVILSCYRAPKSFTGEDLIEINCHGGQLVTNKILKLLLSVGIRLADPGEFSKRAYLNNKIDLMQAEAINDLINAENETVWKTSISIISQKSAKLIDELSEELLQIIAEINVNIDYPEYEDILNVTNDIATEKIKKFLESILIIKNQSNLVQQIKSGIDTVIIGRPNVGKSSLLNALLKEDKAIVSNISGTTRDFVEGKINIGAISINLIDTAGIRDSKNQIEKIGIKRTKQAIDKAQLVILVLDGSKPLTKVDWDLIDMVNKKNNIIAINKSDLGLKLKLVNAVVISALSNKVEDLLNAINEKFITNKVDLEDKLILTNVRQMTCLEKIETLLNQSLVDLKSNIPVDLVVIYLQEAWNQLLELQGKNENVSLIEEIFQRFCLGK